MKSQAPQESRFNLFGAPFREYHYRVVDGELTDEDWEEIVTELRRRTRGRGKVGQVGRIREWSRVVKDSDMTLHRLQVTLKPNIGSTSVKLEKDFSALLIGTYLLSFLGPAVLTGFFLDGSGLGLVSTMITMAGVGLSALATSRLIFTFWRRSHRQRLKDIGKFIQQTIESASGRTDAGDKMSTGEASGIVEATYAKTLDGPAEEGRTNEGRAGDDRAEERLATLEIPAEAKPEEDAPDGRAPLRSRE